MLANEKKMQNISNITTSKNHTIQSQSLLIQGENSRALPQQDGAKYLHEDTVNISEYAKKLASYSRDGSDESIQAENASQNSSGGEMPEGDKVIQKLREQIKELQEKIQEAQQRLIEAQSSDNSQKNKNSDPNESALQDAIAMVAESTEAESIRAEIEMLNQQLLILNDQLKEAMQGEV